MNDGMGGSFHESPPEHADSVGVCQGIGGTEVSPYVVAWKPQGGGPGASYRGEDLSIPAGVGSQQLAYAPIDAGLGVFAHQGVWHQSGVISGWIDLPEPYLEVRLPLAGTTEVLTGTGRRFMETPQFAALNIEPPGTPCEHYNPVGELNSRIVTLITASRLQKLFGADALAEQLRFIETPDEWPTINVPVPMTDGLRRVSQQMMQADVPQPLARLFFHAKVVEALYLVLLGFLPLRNETRTGPRISGRDRQLAQRARERLMANLGRPPLVQDLARSVGIGQRRLNRLFQIFYGGTVLQCLGQWRMDYAKTMLRADLIPIKELAFRLGYDHVHNFTTAFQRRVGMPPGEFRAAYRARFTPANGLDPAPRTGDIAAALPAFPSLSQCGPPTQDLVESDERPLPPSLFAR